VHKLSSSQAGRADIACWVAARYTIAFSTLAVVSAVLFRRGRWKTRAV
jgi:hypothetical protein